MNTTTAPTKPDTANTTLHLTQLLVPYELAIGKLRIRDAYDWHQKIWQAFDGRDGQARDFLVKIDRKEENYRVLVLSQSPPSKPDWCPTDCFGTKIVPDKFFENQKYRFSLLANPTKKMRVDNPDGTRKKNGRRVPLVKREDLISWINRKADGGGFEINPDSLRTIPRGREYFHKPGAKGTLSAVEFQGELAINDPTKFRAAFAKGIGSAKAFGFGLIALAPLS